MRKILILYALFSQALLAGTNADSWVATGKNMAALKALPIRIVLPTELLSEYTFFDYSIQEEKTNPNYTAIFLKDASHWYQIESSNELGDADWENAVVSQVKTELFGEVSLQFTKTTNSQEVIKTSMILSDWMCGKDYRIKKRPAKARCYHLFGRGITSDEAAKVLKGLKTAN